MLSSYLRLVLPSGFLPSGSQTGLLYAFFILFVLVPFNYNPVKSITQL